MSCRTYRSGQYGLGAHGALTPCFPESLTRKLYRKKIPEMTLNVPHVPGFSGHSHAPANNRSHRRPAATTFGTGRTPDRGGRREDE